MRTLRTTLPLLLVLGCSSPPLVEAPRAPWDAPPLDAVVAVRDGRDGSALELEELFERLAGAEAVFLGETHLDETTHRLELAVYEALLERHGGRVVLSLEMFERDAQGDLDDYLAGRLSEDVFLARARPWGNYREAYRPLIERARAEGLPVVAANFPAPVRRRLAGEDAEAVLAGIAEEEPGLVPTEWHANTPGYWRRVDNAIRGHIGMMGPPPTADDPRLFSTQSLWDNSMGDAVARALERHPGHVVLHVNGGFHSAYRDGAVRQTLLRRPGTRVLTVSITPSSSPFSAEVGGAPVADYVAFAEARAEDASEGTRSVRTARDVKYRLHVPERAGERARVPLLIWLGEDGFTSADGMALVRARLGDGVAVLAMDPLHRETAEDLVQAGRWFWADAFNADLGASQTALERAWGYVLRHHPVDPERVVVVGEGSGATVAVAAAIHGGLDAPTLALRPRGFTKLKDIPLPLPELRGDEPAPSAPLHVLTHADDADFWTQELGNYEAIGRAVQLEAPAADTDLDAAAWSWMRERLGLARQGEPAGPEHFVVAHGDRARAWARLRAIELERELGHAVRVVPEPPANTPPEHVHDLAPTPEDLRTPGRIPKAAGPFGGTTVLVLGPWIEGSEREAWEALERDDPLQAASRFHRLRLAELGGERDLALVLSELAEAGRNNVLIVPAEFCAEPSTMHGLRAGVRALESRMNLQWRPGLGGIAD